MKKRILAIGLAILMSVTCVAETAFAHEIKCSGTNTISPTKSQFEKAEDETPYKKQTQTISTTIAKNKMKIYHYECPAGGYYQVYTTGSLLDTVGAVYEEQNALLKKSFKRRAYNDDGNMDKNNTRNFSMVVDMDKYEDYYVCVRGYNSASGKCNVVIEPNQDKTSLHNYGVWTADKIPNSAILANFWTEQKIYINAEQAIMYYWALEPATQFSLSGKSYTMNKLKDVYETDNQLAVDILKTICGAFIDIPYKAVEVTIGVADNIFSDLMESKKSFKEKMQENLINICGVKQTVNVNTLTGKWSATNGMIITKNYNGNSLFDPYYYSYSKYNCKDTLKGVKWYRGKWTY